MLPRRKITISARTDAENVGAQFWVSVRPMVSMSSFIRKTPALCIRTYFNRSGVGLESAVDWSSSGLARELPEAIDKLAETSRSRVLADIERIVEMADEPGQTALYGVIGDKAALDLLQNGHARAVHVFVNNREAFQRAEEVRFTDERRRSRRWDGFAGPRNIEARKDPSSLDRLRALISERFGSPNVQVEAFDRSRPRFGGEDYALAQVTVYRDGRPDEVLEFVEGTLDRKPHRPVYEAAITYEKSTGAIEVVADDQETRKDLARLFVNEILGQRFADKPLPLRRYDLRVLLRPHNFPTEPEDRIEAVHVNELRLAAVDAISERITLESIRRPKRTIWDMAADRFGLCNPLHGGWYITRVKFTITFQRTVGARVGRRLPVTITTPHGCDLKDGTEMERIIGEKYLKRWSIVKDV